MRRHSTVTEKPHCHITYKLQDDNYANEWIDNGISNTRSHKSKKLTNRKNLQMCTMTASILPATNMYNEYHVKYHSVSAGSALSQSMKYAETWLYGSLSVKPPVRPTFLNVDPNLQGPLSIFPNCCCSNHSCSNCGKTNTCNQCLVPIRNFNSVQAFGTVRAKNGVHFYHGAQACHENSSDPYDIVRQSRLGGMKSLTVRAKSHSPSKRKLIPFMAVNRLPSPEVIKSESKANDEVRRSILECKINPYDLLRKVPDGVDDENALLVSDDDLIETVNGKSNKKHRPSLKDKIKSKLQDSGGAKSKTKSLPFSSSSKLKNKSGDSVDGVSIAGQKIRIFNTPTPSSAEGMDDWISDPSFDDEPELEVDLENVINKEQDEAPKRPPRRKSVKMFTSTPTESDSTAIYENYNALSSTSKKEVTKTTNTSSTSSNYGDIKSILKKPLNTPLNTVAIANCATYDSSTCLSPEAFTNGISSTALANVDSRTIDGTTITQKHVGGGIDSNQNFYLTTFSDKHRTNRKVKKQVQFKGMQEQTIEDESSCKSAVVTVDAAVNDKQPTYVDGEESTLAKTGCDSETTTSTSAATTPDSKRLQSLSVRDDRSNVDRRSLDQGRRRRRLNVPSSLPLCSQSVVNQCVVNTSQSVVPQNSSLSSVFSVASEAASDHSIDTAQGRNVVASEPTAVRLHRTQSECSGARPLLAQKHCETFKDTMRLRLRCNPQIEPKRLFYQENTHNIKERSANLRRACLRPAIPPPLPPNVETANKLVAAVVGPISAPKLPPRQYFPFEKSDNHSPANCSPNEEPKAEMNFQELVDRKDTADVPSLTKAFLQSRNSCGEKDDNSFMAGSVIKINVAPEIPKQSLQSNHDNRTIVTITPDNSSLEVAREQPEEADDSSVSSIRTSITINVNDRSPPSVCQSSCNTVTINVGYNNDMAEEKNVADSATSNSCSNHRNNSVYKSNVLITPPSTNMIYVKPAQCEQREENGSSSIGSRTPVTKTVTHLSNENGSSSGSSGISTDSCDNTPVSRPKVNDFSVHYMSCRINEKLTEDEVGLTKNLDDVYDSVEPIYEEISETPPPLPSEPPPERVDDIGILIPPRSIFEGASKYDILKYLAGAKERCRMPEEPSPEFVIEEIADSENGDLPLPVEHSRVSSSDLSSRLSHLSNVSDSSDELASFLMCSGINNAISLDKAYRNCTDIERNDSGVGSETSKCSRSKWQHVQASSLQEDQQHICEDCEQPVEAQVSESGLTYAPLVCRKCSKKRIERREIIAEIVETEEKYGRDLRIILDEFYKPMLVAGLLTPDQLSSIFLNVEELLEHNTTLAEKLRDGYEIAIEQGDEDLLTFNIGKIFLDAAPMLHAFESYCTRQGNAALLLANLEKDKELLKIFLRVSQMENTVLRRMNLNSFLMVPVQRVTKYPLLLARLYKVTPEHHTNQRDLLKEAQHNIELHLEHINSLTKDIGSMKIWRRISMMNGRRVSSDVDDIVNIKLQKIAVEVLEWGHEEVRFAMEGRLLYAQPTDSNWKRAGRTIKVVPVSALLVTLGKPTENYNPECEDRLTFPQKNGIREASLLLMKEKGGKYSLVRDPLCLDHCIIYCDSDCEEYFEVQEIPTKDTYIFKAEDEERTRQWYKQLQYHSQGLGCWRKRRNALANIMINGMQVRS